MAVSVATALTAAFLAWRERPEPGASALATLMCATAWWSATFSLKMGETMLGPRVFWSNLQWLGIVVIPVAWVLFAFEYTGRDKYVRDRYVALLLVVPAVTVVLVWTGAYHDLMFGETMLVPRGDSLVLERTRGPWFWVITGYTYLLASVGSVLCLSLVGSDALPFRGQSVALLVAAITPLASNVFFLLGIVDFAGLDPTPLAFTVSGVASLGALTQFRLLGTSPAPNRRARRLVFERMRDGAVVIDSHDYVVDMNESAVDVLGTTPRETLGRPAVEVVPWYEEFPDDGETAGHVTVRDEASGDPYDVTVTRIDDFRGRDIGRIIAFHDVSEHFRHQQRLEVLNRVLRHNIRNETNVIYGYADLVADEGGAESERAEIIKERAITIAEMGEKARQIVDIFEQVRQEPQAVLFADLVGKHVTDADERFPEVAIRTDALPVGVRVNAVLGPALSNLVENAAEHNTDADPYVEIDATVSDGWLRVVVADNGPGIGDHERAVLERGTETALKHGSGLGLWLVTWAVGIADGTVEFEENDPTGSVVTVEVPTLPVDDETSEETAAAETAETRSESVENALHE